MDVNAKNKEDGETALPIVPKFEIRVLLMFVLFILGFGFLNGHLGNKIVKRIKNSNGSLRGLGLAKFFRIFGWIQLWVMVIGILAAILIPRITDIINRYRMKRIILFLRDSKSESLAHQKTEEITFNEEELKQYYAVYKDPYVIHLRKALNEYLDGSNKGMAIPDTVIEDIGIGKKSGLDSFDKSYYKSRFVVLSINDSITGGKHITIIFQNKQDKIFTAWVYNAGGDKYDMRGFWQEDTPDEKLNEIVKTYRKFIKDRKHSL